MKKIFSFALVTAFFLNAFVMNQSLAQGVLTNPIFSENFGTIADGTDLNTSNTAFSFTRVSTGTTANYITNQIKAKNPGAFTGSSCMLGAKSTSITTVDKTGLTSFSSGTFIFKFKTPADLTSAVLFSAVGTGNSFGSANIFTGNQVSAGFQVTGTNLQIRANSAWTTVQSVTTSTTYEVCVVFNNTASDMTYGANITLPANKAHIWVDGVRATTDYTSATASLAASAFRIYVTTAEFEVDDIAVYNTLPGASTLQVATPTFTPAGGTYSSPQSVTIACTTAGATIYYTTDGSTPTTASSIFSTAINVPSSITLKAMATAAGMSNSDIATATYTINTTTIPSIVISGMYGAGGNAGAAFQNDYIEIHNTTNSTINLAGYTLYYASAGGTTSGTGSYFTFPAGATIGAHKFALIKAASGGTNGTAWPTSIWDFDASGTGSSMNLAAASGKILLLRIYHDLSATNSIPTTLAGIQGMADYVDYVPFGTTAVPVFGTTMANLSTTLAATRKYNDATQTIAYTFDVGADFSVVTVTATTPRNSSYGAVNQVATPTFNIPTGTYTSTQNIEIACTTAGATIYYTLDGSTPTATSTPYTTGTPIPVSVTTTVKAIAMKTGMDNSNVASATYTFPILVATIAEFKTAHAALAPTGTATSTVPYKITGNVTFVERLGRNIYIKDATGGLLIFDNTTPVITKNYNNGDIISGGVIGTCTRYNGLFELIPLFDLATGTAGTPVTPTILTMANLLANFTNYESQLVKLEKVTFGEDKVLGASATAGGANVAIFQGADEMILRNNYNTFTGYETNPNSLFDVTGFIVPYVTTTANDKQICPRDSVNDIKEVEFTIIFKNWDNSVLATQTYHYGDPVVLPENPTRPADNTYTYTFNGWNPAVVTPVVGDATYTATYTSTYINYTITVVASPTGGGNVGGGGNSFHYGDNAYLTATANTGYTFSHWNDGNTNATRTVTVTGNATYTATFTPNAYTLTFDASPVVLSPNTMPVYYGQPVGTMLTATRPGYTLSGWFTGLNGTGTQITATTVWNTLGNVTVYAYWTSTTYTLTLDPGTGTCPQPSIQVTYNSPILSLPNASQPGCNFVGWFIGATQISTGFVWTYTSNQTAVARFTYPVAATNNNPTLGTISPSGTINYNLGDSPAYTCTPNSNAYIVSVIVDGTTVFSGVNGTSAPFTHTFTNIGAAHTIEVNFGTNCYPMNPGNMIPNGVTVTMNPSGCVPHGSPVTFTFSSDCYDITKILIGGSDVGLISSYTIPSVTGPLPLIEVQATQRKYTITATPLSGVDPMGEISPSGTQTVNCGDNVTYQFITQLGYSVKALYIDGISVPVPPTHSYTFSNVKSNHTIHVEFQEYPYYIIQFGPSAAQNAGGVVYPVNFPNAVYYVAVDSGTVSFPFAIVPAQGYVIDKVYVDNTSDFLSAQTGIYTFTNVNSNHSIYATFKPVMFTITATSDPNGSITPSGAVPVAYGSSQDFQARPNPGYSLSAVVVDGVLDAQATQTGVYTFTNVQSNHTISAFFTKNYYLITTISGAHGSITPENPMVGYGENQKFTITPDEGYKIDQVLIDGVSNPIAAQTGTYTFTNVMEEHVIAVTFARLGFTITSTCTSGGFITPAGLTTVYYDEHSPIYVFSAETGYYIKSVIVDGFNNAQAVEDGIYRFLNVKADHSIHVIFAPGDFVITATATQGGTINPSGLVSVPQGSDKKFTFAAKEGYRLTRVMVDGVPNDLAAQTGFYTFPNITDNHIISAQFENNMLQVYLPSGAGFTANAEPGYSTTVAYGSKFSFTVTLLEGYTQSKITVRANGIVINAGVTGVYTINTITTDQYVTINGIALNEYSITTKSSAGGTISPFGTFIVTHGDSKVFEIIPNTGYKISDVVVNSDSQGAAEVYTFSNIKSDAVIEAYFKPAYVGIDENEAGTITVFSQSNVVIILNDHLIPVKQVEIMDMLGRTVWQGVATADKTQISLNVPTGIYGVRIMTESNILTTKVLIR